MWNNSRGQDNRQIPHSPKFRAQILQSPCNVAEIAVSEVTKSADGVRQAACTQLLLCVGAPFQLVVLRQAPVSTRPDDLKC